MTYEKIVVEVMDRVIRLANSQISRRMWYQVKNVCPEYQKYIDKRGYYRYHPVLVTVVVHVLRELGFKIRKKKYGRWRKSSYYFLIDLEDLMNS